MANLTFTRKVVQVGGLVTVSLPKCWRDAHGVEKGDRIQMEVLSDGSLLILPLKVPDFFLNSPSAIELPDLKDNQNGAGAHPGAGSPESDASAATQEASS